MGPSLNWKTVRQSLNFYRIHILFFTFTPLLFSAIFYACNGRNKISYVDALFNCISAMAVCGLATVNLSSLTGFQQAILFFQMCIGSPVVVSWVMVYLRKFYFAKKFDHIIAAAKARAADDVEKSPWPRRMFSGYRSARRTSTHDAATTRQDTDDEEEAIEKKKKKKKKGFMRKLRPDMIQRMDKPPQLVNPSGWISEGAHTPIPSPQPPSSPQPSSSTIPPENAATPDAAEKDPMLEDKDTESSSTRPRHLTFFEAPIVASPQPHGPEPVSPSHSTNSHLRPPLPRRLSDPGRTSPQPTSPITSSFPRSDTVALGALPRTQTIEFAPETFSRRTRIDRTHPDISEYEPSVRSRRSGRRSSFHREDTYIPMSGGYPSGRSIKNSGFGGFPMPHEIAKALFSRFFPKLQRHLSRTVTLPRTTTLMSRQNSSAAGAATTTPYFSFDTIVGRNSAFHQLTREQQDELGGVEYRALKALLWIVAGYHFTIQVVALTVIAPYISTDRWASVFLPPNQIRPLPSSWFAVFQTVSAYTNTGMSLVDQSMVPFQKAYPMILVMAACVLAGNTMFPILLRLSIWLLTKIVPNKSRANETLHFLLDHPRRCFIYLFPSHQTWFLLTVVLTLTLTDWIFFLVLDIGNPAIESIPLGTRFAIGFLQALAVRAAGFGTVSIAALAPAVKFLYMIMMYVSVYPIAMSVRSTNVYEEQSLGVFQDHESDDEENFDHAGSRVTVWSRYLTMHARKQLAFDMWWLGLAIFLVCIIERDNLQREDNLGWFNIFSVVFELVSAYGTVGLSLGIPTENFSFSGAFRPLSKLIVCLVMIRGRHRGLPVAIDRAVLLPMEFAASKTEPDSAHTDGAEGMATGHEKADDGEWRLRRMAQHRSMEEASLSAARRNAMRLDNRL
ncbi:Potassium transport protein [Mycena kentingensis (nom. inval.)]|nr:Potassium transport protein [Mycena kentingensis (nom. inval.)]